MKRFAPPALACALSVCLMAVPLVGCGGSSDAAGPSGETTAAEEKAPAEEPAAAEESSADVPADGTYSIEVKTDSSMFRGESCLLHVDGGTYTAELSLPGEGFSRLYFGTAEEAQTAADEDIYDYRLNDEGKYTFDVPVSALDEELVVAAYGQRRDTWYDHTIVFCAPTDAAVADAA